MVRLTLTFHLWVMIVCLGGCAASRQPTIPPTPASLAAVKVATPSLAVQQSGSQGTLSQKNESVNDFDRLARLWQARKRESGQSGYPLGPGDVLEISVPEMPELAHRTVRITDEGTIALPFVGGIRINGLTEAGLRQKIERRLEKGGYMYDPQVDILVQEYRSRQVAVSGAVEKPGLYSLARRTETLLDMVSLAGGLTKEASQQILLIPAEYGAHGKAAQHSSGQAIQPTSEATASYALDTTNPIRIDLTDLSKGGNPLSLTLPARPGDVIIVPGSGEVLVGGWVVKPGSYKITPGLTVLGAVTAAGGPMFAADTHTVKIVRPSKAGKSAFFIADLEKIKRGESPDIPVQDSDIIEASASSARLVPYGFYQFFSSVFRTGATFRIE